MDLSNRLNLFYYMNDIIYQYDKGYPIDFIVQYLYIRVNTKAYKQKVMSIYDNNVHFSKQCIRQEVLRIVLGYQNNKNRNERIQNGQTVLKQISQ